jgi:hypothetical protein
MAQMEALQRRLRSIDVSDPSLYQDDAWRPIIRHQTPVLRCAAPRAVVASEARRDGTIDYVVAFAPRNDARVRKTLTLSL